MAGAGRGRGRGVAGAGRGWGRGGAGVAPHPKGGAGVLLRGFIERLPLRRGGLEKSCFVWHDVWPGNNIAASGRRSNVCLPSSKVLGLLKGRTGVRVDLIIERQYLCEVPGLCSILAR